MHTYTTVCMPAGNTDVLVSNCFINFVVPSTNSGSIMQEKLWMPWDCCMLAVRKWEVSCLNGHLRLPTIVYTASCLYSGISRCGYCISLVCWCVRQNAMLVFRQKWAAQYAVISQWNRCTRWRKISPWGCKIDHWCWQCSRTVSILLYLTHWKKSSTHKKKQSLEISVA